MENCFNSYEPRKNNSTIEASSLTNITCMYMCIIISLLFLVVVLGQRQ